MDESTFDEARRRLNPYPCVFEKALLAGCCACSLALRYGISERETVACTSETGRKRCAALRALLRQNSLFALKCTPGAPLPHAKEMKAMCGGLLGLQRLLEPAGEVSDVFELVEEAIDRFGSLDALPYSAIMPAVAAFELRRRKQ